MLNELDLFAGIGGIALGLRRAELCRSVCYVENDSYAQSVLQARMHNGQLDEAPIWDDVTTFDGTPWRGVVDIVAGGFPCQDISVAGKGEGIEGSRSGLWGEMRRVIGEVRPSIVFIENVPALLTRGLDRVLADLAALGFDAEWDCISASAVGAPHRRDRVWIVGYALGNSLRVRRGGQRIQYNTGKKPRKRSEIQSVANTKGQRRGRTRGPGEENGRPATKSNRRGKQVAHDTSRERRQGRPGRSDSSGQGKLESTLQSTDSKRERLEGQQQGRPATGSTHGSGDGSSPGWWSIEPDVGRVVARISSWMDGGKIGVRDKSEGGTAEILRALPLDPPKEKIQWPARGFGGLQTEEILLSELCEYEGPPKPLGNISLESEKASGVIVRGVWFNGKTSCSSCRRLATKQRSDEYSNPVRILPQLLACVCQSTWLDPTGTPSESPRIDRLRCLGNAVVPQVVEVIGRRIKEALVE